VWSFQIFIVIWQSWQATSSRNLKWFNIIINHSTNKYNKISHKYRNFQNIGALKSQCFKMLGLKKVGALKYWRFRMLALWASPQGISGGP
jgi:hypothetical protein